MSPHGAQAAESETSPESYDGGGSTGGEGEGGAGEGLGLGTKGGGGAMSPHVHTSPESHDGGGSTGGESGAGEGLGLGSGSSVGTSTSESLSPGNTAFLLGLALLGMLESEPVDDALLLELPFALPLSVTVLRFKHWPIKHVPILKLCFC
jgi:hypothetical protein